MERDFLIKEAETLQLLAEGNQTAFRSVYDRYALTTYRIALRYLRSTKLAEDLVQEVFSTVWLNRTNFATVQNFRSYLFIMVRNLAFKYLRDMAKEEVARAEYNNQQMMSDNCIDRYLFQKEYENLVQQAVEQLPPQRKLVFQLAKVEGLSHKAIAEQLDLSHITVSNHIVLALKYIRQCLQEYIA